MKKLFSYFSLVVLASLLISCSALSSDSSTATGLAVRMPSVQKSSREATASDSSSWYDEVTSFTVTVESAASANSVDSANQNQEQTSLNNFYQTKTAKSGEDVLFEEIPVGSYIVSISARNSSGEEIGTGSNAATVEQGRVSKVTIQISKSEINYADLEFDGKAKIGETEYDSLSEAIIAANAGSGNVTITFTGNIEENPSNGENKVTITNNIIIDLNGNVFSWKAIEDAREYSPFNIPDGKTLVIKNGTIISPDDEDEVHSASLIEANGNGDSKFYLSNLKILNVVTNSRLIDIENKSSLYTSNVSIKNCQSNGNGAIYIAHDSKFYALNTNIINVLGTDSSVYVLSASGSFVGGKIILSSEETLSNGTEFAKRDNALHITSSESAGQSSFGISSTTVYSNTAYHGYPVFVDNSSFNLANGVEFYKFDELKMEAEQVKTGEKENKYVSLSEIDSNYKDSPNILAAAKSAEVIKSTDSTEYALNLAYTATMYMNHNAEIYGLVQMNLANGRSSAIAQTGELISDVVTRLDFGNDIDSYASLSGNYPLYWGAGAEVTDTSASNYKDNSFDTSKFAVHKNNGYNGEYTIKATTRKVASSDSINGNAIYAPQMSQ